MSFVQKIGEGFTKVGNATKEAAQKTKLKAEIYNLQTKITHEKEKFGVKVWPFLMNDDFHALEQIKNETKQRIHRLTETLQRKEDELLHFDERKGKRRSQINYQENQTYTPSPSMVDISSLENPNSLKNPNSCSTIPSEWMILQTNEGQDYYYNTVTGETRWESPSAT